MPQPGAMTTAVRLGVSVDALAALAAYARLETEDLPADPQVRELLSAIAAEVLDADSGADGLANRLSPEHSAALVGLARTFFRQSAELVENPGRSGSWDLVDPSLLQAIGRLSMGIVEGVRAAEGASPPFGVRLRTHGARLLDVGTGSGWLSIALARAYPDLRVDGIDIFTPALDLARENVASEGLAERVSLRQQDVTELPADASYDVVWLPLPFLPKGPAVAAMTAALGALQPGGWLLAGTFAGTDTRLSQLLTDLRTVRSGGHPWPSAELLAAIAGAGFADGAEVERTWPSPVRLYLARRPTTAT
jgi:2-polyprenyl-3-methyl-5-hydroxy-6-metoxy-1,4-benzoquinol methylase